MILTVEKLKSYDEFKDLTDEDALTKLNSVESLIRSYTNNKFQVKDIRLVCSSSNGVLNGYLPYFKVGDTVEISASKYNDGLYTITNLDENSITLNDEIFDVDEQRVTKISYPDVIIQGAINLLKWDVQNRSKVGVQSESIGRHSVTYFNQDGGNSTMGYPASLLTFLDVFKKARF